MWITGLAKGDSHLRLLYSGVQIDLRRDHEGCQQQNKPYKFAEGPSDKKTPNLTSARSANPRISFRLHLTSPRHYPLQHCSADGTTPSIDDDDDCPALLWTQQHSHNWNYCAWHWGCSYLTVLYTSYEVYDHDKFGEIQASMQPAIPLSPLTGYLCKHLVIIRSHTCARASSLSSTEDSFFDNPSIGDDGDDFPMWTLHPDIEETHTSGHFTVAMRFMIEINLETPSLKTTSNSAKTIDRVILETLFL